MHDQIDLGPVIGSRICQSYILRIWQEETGAPWRAMLRGVACQEEHLFHDVEALAAFLERKMDPALPEMSETD